VATTGVHVKSTVEVDVNVPQATLAALFADPRLCKEWMDDLDRYEPISGAPGMPGSTYRLVPKTGRMVFVATVQARNLPNDVRLSLDASNVTVTVTGTFVAVEPTRSRLRSEEVFTFKGALGKLVGFFAQTVIRSAHRRHIHAFKRFAEKHG
jgi:hypothetical protein